MPESIANIHTNTHAAAATIPPASPAQVFDGLIAGAIFGPPIARPAKNAPLSVNTAMPITSTSRNVPAPASTAAASPKYAAPATIPTSRSSMLGVARQISATHSPKPTSATSTMNASSTLPPSTSATPATASMTAADASRTDRSVLRAGLRGHATARHSAAPGRRNGPAPPRGAPA